LNSKRIEVVRKFYNELGKEVITRKELYSTRDKLRDELPLVSVRWIEDNHRVTGKSGHYRLPIEILDGVTDSVEISQESVKGKVKPKAEVEVEEIVTNAFNFIPVKDPSYVSWGHHRDIESIVKSKIFYPTFITGLSGNGKTFMVEQICAKLKREVIRVNVTVETDEDDLLGGFRLVDGETQFHKGPVVEAMERGAVLLLDEVDLASTKILALQPVLEGKGVFLKKINQWITPKDGFNVIATANTKGKGSESGSFIGTNILNEAFLERFAVTFEQEYPTNANELKIVKNTFKDNGIEDDVFADHLVKWADIIRKTYYDGGVDEVISTRRLVHVSKAYSIFQDKLKAIDLCIARFDDDTKQSFKELYGKVDADVDVDGEENSEKKDEYNPF